MTRVNILEPFAGTGTFLTRLMQTGLIRPEDLSRKYASELFANEIVLLSYYIAAVNIESVYRELCAEHGIEPDEGGFAGSPSPTPSRWTNATASSPEVCSRRTRRGWKSNVGRMSMSS